VECCDERQFYPAPRLSHGEKTLACCCVELHHFCGIDNLPDKDDHHTNVNALCGYRESAVRKMRGGDGCVVSAGSCCR
jgi:hypothetical protein